MTVHYTPAITDIDALVARKPDAALIVPGRRERAVILQRYPDRNVISVPSIVARLTSGRTWLTASERQGYLRLNRHTADLLLTRQWALNRDGFAQLPEASKAPLADYARWLGEQNRYEYEDLLRLALDVKPGMLFAEALALEAQQYSPLVRRLLVTTCLVLDYAGDPHAATLRRIGAGDLLFPGAPEQPPAAVVAGGWTYRSASGLAEQIAREVRHCRAGPGAPPLHALGIVVRVRLELPYLQEALLEAGIPTSSESMVDSFEAPLAKAAQRYLKWLIRPQVRLALRGTGAADALRLRLSCRELEALCISPWVGGNLDEFRRLVEQARRQPPNDIGSGLNVAALPPEECADEELVDRLTPLLPRRLTRRFALPPEGTKPRAAVARWVHGSPAFRRWQERGDTSAQMQRAVLQEVLRFLRPFNTITDALAAWLDLEAEDADDAPVHTQLLPDTVHLLRPHQVAVGAYRTLWVTGLTEGCWPATPKARSLRLLATGRGATLADLREEHLATEAALWRAAQRGLDAEGDLRVHVLTASDASVARYLADLPTSAPIAVPLTVEEQGAQLEYVARTAPSAEEPEADRAARIVRFALARKTVPMAPPTDLRCETERPVWNGDLALSATQLDTYRSCPQQYVFRYVYRIGEGDEQGRMGFGSLVHKLLQEAFTFTLPDWNGEGEIPRAGMPASLPEEQRQVWLLERLYALATSGDFEFAGPYLAVSLERRLKAFRFLDGALREAPVDPEFTVRAVEHRFTLPLPELADLSTLVRGVVDRVDRTPEDPTRLKLWDYKTGKRPSDLSQKREETVRRHVQEELQLATYSVAATVDQVLHSWGTVAEIEYRFLPEIDAGYAEGIPAAAPPPESTDARQRLIALSSGIATGQFAVTPQHRPNCMFCDFAPVCHLKDANPVGETGIGDAGQEDGA